jgi:hypothetical protein
MTTLRATVCPRCWGRQFEPSFAGNPCLLCDGRGHVEDCLLSPHFSFGELVATSHQEFANDPDALQIEHLRRLCLDLLEPVRAIVGPLRVTSGYRSRCLDAHVGGPEWLTERLSAHAVGYAADVQPVRSGAELRDVVEAVLACGKPFDQVILEGGCCHIAVRSPVGERQRMEVLVRLPGVAPKTFRYARFTGESDQLAAVV